MFGKIVLSISIGFGAAFIGYCFYYDRQRLRDPDYKKKVHLRRLRESQKETVNMSGPNSPDPTNMERYFVDQINLAEIEINNKHFESGVEHLARAVLICSQTDRLMQVLQVSLSDEVFALLVNKLHELGRNGFEAPTPRQVFTNIIDELE